MKRIATSALALIIFGVGCMAQQVPDDVCRKAAVNFWNAHREDANKTIGVDDPTLYTFSQLPMLRVFAVGAEGFVIVAAYDGALPVVGYSFDSPASDQLNPEVAFWLRGINDDIAAAASEGRRSPQAIAEWDSLLNAPTPAGRVSLKRIPALVQTRWDQSEPYNKMCPFDSNYHQRTVVGCVATAMAQIMKYWNHPSSGTGSHSYIPHGSNYPMQSADFGNTTYIWEYMNDRYEQMVSSSERSERAVALLSYHCGVAVNMMYGPSATGGSGAYSSCGYWTSACAENAFYEYFKYSPDLEYRQRNGNIMYNGAYVETFYYSDSAWCAMIDADLEQGRPMYYSGSDSTGGHAFVLDGSDSDRRYHFNWGWSGLYDGMYHINNVAPGAGGTGSNATHSFNHSQGAIFGIVPLEEHFDTATIYDTTCNNYSVYRFHDYEFPTVSNTLEAIWLDTVFTIHLKVLNWRSLYINPNGGGGIEDNITFCPAEGVVLPENRFVRPGFGFIGWGERRANNDTIYQPGDTLHWRMSKTIYAQWQDSSHLALVDPGDTRVMLYPNPTDGDITLLLPDADEASVFVCDALGRVLTGRTTVRQRAKIDFSDLPAGTYTIVVATNHDVYKKQIIKR